MTDRSSTESKTNRLLETSKTDNVETHHFKCAVHPLTILHAVVKLGSFSISKSTKESTASITGLMCCKPILLLKNK
jgi:hypothetical protein